MGPDTMSQDTAAANGSLASRHLYTARIDLDPLMVGPTPEGTRAIFRITGGTIEGPRLRGRFLANGADWARIRADGSVALDVRSCVETDDGAVIYITYGGRLVIPPAIMPAVLDLAAPSRPAAETYYFRILPLFEAADERYAWLNGICAVGAGEVVTGGVMYRVFAID